MTWLQLMRLPTIFTALSNILCGYLITAADHDLSALLSQSDLWLLLASSTGLYFGGMVLNDVFDAKLDAVERPERPIPSGRISLRSAAIFPGREPQLALFSVKKPYLGIFEPGDI